MALNERAFRAKHIPGSEHFNTPGETFTLLRPDEEIVVYARASIVTPASRYLALVDAGFAKVRRYAGGLSEWEEAGLALEGDWA